MFYGPPGPSNLGARGGRARERPPVIFEDIIYDASATGLLDLIRHASSAARTIAVFGHDPAIQELALALAGTASDAARGASAGPQAPDAVDRTRTKFPAAAVAVLEFSGLWSRLSQGQARLATFVTPRAIRRSG